MFLDLKKLSTDLQTNLDEMDACAKAIADARTAGKTDDVKTKEELYAQLKGKNGDLMKDVERAKEQERLRAARLEVEKMVADSGKAVETPAQGKTETGGKTGKVNAEAKDHEKDEAARCEFFYDYVRGKSLSDEARKSISPKSAKLKESEEAADSVVIPDRLLGKIMGRNFMQSFGKAAGFMSTLSTDAAGVVNLVPQEYRAQLLQLPFDTPSIMDLVTILPSGTGNLTFPTLTQTDSNEFGGVSFSWVQEGAEKPLTDPAFGQTEIPTYELAGYTEISERALSRSSIGLEALLGVLFRSAMAYTLDTVILTGDGNSKPTGITQAAGIRQVNRQTLSQVDHLDLVNLKRALKPNHRAGAYYFINDDVGGYLEGKKDGENRPLFAASVASGPYDRLAGYPYRETTNQPELGSEGDVIFGNPRHYIMAMEEEITMKRSEHAQFRKNRIAFKVFTVVGGKPVLPRAFAWLNDATS